MAAIILDASAAVFTIEIAAQVMSVVVRVVSLIADISRKMLGKFVAVREKQKQAPSRRRRYDHYVGRDDHYFE